MGLGAPARRRGSAAAAAALALLLAAPWCAWASPEAGPTRGTAYIGSGAGGAAGAGSSSLLAALRDPSVSRIVVEGNYTVDAAAFEPYIHPAPPLPITRNLTITGAAGLDSVLDLQFVYSAVELCGACTLTLDNITLTGERRGTGGAVDFVLGQPGSRMIERDVYRLRLSCTSTNSTYSVISSTPRSSAFPGTGGAQAFGARDAAFQGALYRDQLVLGNYTAVVPRAEQEGRGPTGGYALADYNVVRVCLHEVPASCLEEASPDACVNSAIDDMLAAQRAAAAPQPRRLGPGALAAAVAAPVLGAALAALLAALAWRRRRARGRRPELQPPKLQQQSLSPPGGSFGGSGCCNGAAGACAVDDAIVAEMRSQESYTRAYDELGGKAVSKPQGLSNGWSLLHSVTTPTIPSAGDGGSQIELGELLGSGSYGRVYRANWAGQDVAVKIIEHERSTIEAVENEVALMMSFQDCNIVRALHVDLFVCDAPPTPSLCDTCSTGGGSTASIGSPPGQAPAATTLHLQHLQQQLLLQPGPWGAAAAPAVGADDAPLAQPDVVTPAHLLGLVQRSRSLRISRASRAETWLVQEYCDLGTLTQVAEGWAPQEEGDGQMLRRLLMLRDVAQGLQVLHSSNVVHGDLNARNVLVSSDASSECGMVAKLADLGLSRVIKQQRTHRTTNALGTLSHMPPELIRYGRMSPAVDVYAYGVMMWEVFTGQAAFRKLHYGQFFEAVVLRNTRPPVPPGMPADYQLLMERCWQADAAARPSAEVLLRCMELMVGHRRHPGGTLLDSARELCGRPGPPPVAELAALLGVPPPPQQQQQQQQQHRQQGDEGSAHSVGASWGGFGPHRLAGAGSGGHLVTPVLGSAVAATSSRLPPRYPNSAASQGASLQLDPLQQQGDEIWFV